MPLPELIYLPFVDRPDEVAQLMMRPPSAKLFALLAKVYYTGARKLTGTESAGAKDSLDPGVQGLCIMASRASPGSAFYATSPLRSRSPMPLEISVMGIPGHTRSTIRVRRTTCSWSVAQGTRSSPAFAHLSMRPALGSKYVLT